MCRQPCRDCIGFVIIKADKFYAEAERNNFDNIDPIAIREVLTEHGIIGDKVVDPEKLNNALFVGRPWQTDRIYVEENLIPPAGERLLQSAHISEVRRYVRFRCIGVLFFPCGV